MRRSIATVCLSGTLEDKLAAAAAAGFDEVELFEPDLIASPWTPAEVRAAAAGFGLAIGLYQPFRDFEGVPAERFRANLRRAERKFAVMEELGADRLLVCSNVAGDAIAGDDLAAEQLRALAERAGEHGIQVAYEALAIASPATFEQTSSRSAPSSSMTANLRSARRRFARKRPAGTPSKSRNGW